jgi:hypothetical protein
LTLSDPNNSSAGAFGTGPGLGLEFYNLSGASRVLYHEYVIGIVGMFPVCTTSGSLLHIVVTFTIPFIWIKI